MSFKQAIAEPTVHVFDVIRANGNAERLRVEIGDEISGNPHRVPSTGKTYPCFRVRRSTGRIVTQGYSFGVARGVASDSREAASHVLSLLASEWGDEELLDIVQEDSDDPGEDSDDDDALYIVRSEWSGGVDVSGDPCVSGDEVDTVTWCTRDGVFLTVQRRSESFWVAISSDYRELPEAWWESASDALEWFVDGCDVREARSWDRLDTARPVSG